MMFLTRAGLEAVHFVGIGGAGMSGIAEILLDQGIEVTGSDLSKSEVTERLEELGARISVGHDPSHIGNCDLVVISSAIQPDNPEVIAARERGLSVIRRAEMLGELMRLKYGIAIGGTHGKTTTTSIIGTLLTDAELDPTVIVGGRLRLTGTGARLGRSEFMVAEADEYDRSFFSLSPIVAVVTTVDVDHLDTYGGLDDILDAFVQFASSVPFFGKVILCLDDPNVGLLLPRLGDRRVVTYGFSPQADLVAVDFVSEGRKSTFTVRQAGAPDLGRVELPLPGRHNVQNALAAIAVGLSLGLDFDTIRTSLAGFSGVHRRFEYLGTWQGAEVVDDYAHHPAEVEATLKAARRVFPSGEIHAVFQPHLFSRTRDQALEFGRALLLADTAWVTDIYPSREKPMPGVTSELVVDAAKSAGHRRVRSCGSWTEVPELLREQVKSGDAVLTLGAGDINRLAMQLVSESSVGGSGDGEVSS